MISIYPDTFPNFDSLASCLDTLETSIRTGHQVQKEDMLLRNHKVASVARKFLQMGCGVMLRKEQIGAASSSSERSGGGSIHDIMRTVSLEKMLYDSTENEMHSVAKRNAYESNYNRFGGGSSRRYSGRYRDTPEFRVTKNREELIRLVSTFESFYPEYLVEELRNKSPGKVFQRRMVIMKPEKYYLVTSSIMLNEKDDEDCVSLRINVEELVPETLTSYQRICKKWTDGDRMKLLTEENARLTKQLRIIKHRARERIGGVLQLVQKNIFTDLDLDE